MIIRDIKYFVMFRIFLYNKEGFGIFYNFIYVGENFVFNFLGLEFNCFICIV